MKQTKQVTEGTEIGIGRGIHLSGLGRHDTAACRKGNIHVSTVCNWMNSCRELVSFWCLLSQEINLVQKCHPPSAVRSATSSKQSVEGGWVNRQQDFARDMNNIQLPMP